MRIKKPKYVMLIETKINRDHIERIISSIGYEGYFSISSQGLSGGLAMF